MLLTIIIFLAILSLLVFVHELGHFVVAKKSGMKVHEFGFGFPPRLIGIQKVDGKWKVVWGSRTLSEETTVYSINAIPLGGFVKIMGEDAEATDDPQSFTHKPFWAKFGTLIAGVTMNVILAWVLISGAYMYGLPVAVQDAAALPRGATFVNQQIAIIDVLANTPADQAGFESGDIILRVDDKQLKTVSELQSYIRSNSDHQFTFTIKRLNDLKTIEVRSTTDERGRVVVGVGLAAYGSLSFPWYQSLWEGARTTYNQLGGIVTGLVQVFSSGDGLKSLGGPVKIAQITGEVAGLGVIPLVQFAAFLSLNLAILNTLPFPALDGGRMLFLIIETLRGKRNNQKVEQYANAIGFMLLLLLMLVITVRDVSQLETIRKLFS